MTFFVAAICLRRWYNRERLTLIYSRNTIPNLELSQSLKTQTFQFPQSQILLTLQILLKIDQYLRER